MLYRMIKVSDCYSLEDLCEMTEEDMATLLRFYAPDLAPRMACLQAMKAKSDELDGRLPDRLDCPKVLEKEVGVFDGSFGFAVGWG